MLVNVDLSQFSFLTLLDAFFFSSKRQFIVPSVQTVTSTHNVDQLIIAPAIKVILTSRPFQ